MTMTTVVGEPQILRISPSGQPVGDEENPSLVGGTADPPDGSVQEGRRWIYAGTGAAANVPGSATPGSVTGLDGVQVDMRAGYKYEIQADVDVFGSLVGGEYYVITVDGSTDAGATWATYPAMVSQKVRYADEGAARSLGRARKIGLVVGAVPIDKIRLQLCRKVANADGFVQYDPTTTTLEVVEYL
jgi:hypothetical protein